MSKASAMPCSPHVRVPLDINKLKLHKFVLFLTILFCTHVAYGQTVDQATLNKSQLFGGFGIGFFGHNPKTEFYFSFYSTYGKDFNISSDVKCGVSIDYMKLNWIKFRNDRGLYNGKFDRARYFSFSSDLQAYTRYILSRVNHPNKSYDKYIDLGVGYNLPYYYTVRVFDGPDKFKEKYPNRYYDFYLYIRFAAYELLKAPFTLRLEYHPFDIIKNSSYPNVAPIRMNFEFIINEPDH